MLKLNVAVIGAGYWGKTLIRNCVASKEVELVMVCDKRDAMLDWVLANYPAVQCTKNTDDIFSSAVINAVLIATQVFSHYELAKKALNAGKHVFVEKPMTETAEQSLELVNLAKEKNLILHVDHTFIYTGAVKKIKEIIDAGELGELRYFDSERLNLGLIQPDVNVIYDLAVHDLSILNFILKEKPESVSAFGGAYVTKQRHKVVEELAHIHLKYPSGFMAHIHTSWLSPVKIRKTLIGGNKKMILYNDMEPSEKIKIYDHGVELDFSKETPDNPIYRNGDIQIPHVDAIEALLTEINHFAECIRDGKESITSGRGGYDVVKVIESCMISLQSGSGEISL